MGPKRSNTEAQLPAKRQRKLPASMDEYLVEPVIVISKPSPAKRAEMYKNSPPPRSHQKKPVPLTPGAPTPVPAPRSSKSKASTVAMPTSTGTKSPTSSASVASSSSGKPIDIMSLWSQVWKAMVVVVVCTLATFVFNMTIEVSRGGKGTKMPSAAVIASNLGVLLLWVVGVTLLPFVAISVVVQFMNVYQFGSNSEKSFFAAALALVVALSAQYYAK